MLVSGLLLLLNCKQVYSDLSIEYIQKTVEDIFIDDQKRNLANLKETIANPLFGFFADKTGLFYNIRFFSPYIQTEYEKDRRNFLLDKSDEAISSLLIQLFECKDSQPNTGKDLPSSPLKVFTNFKKESVEFFANLFVAILNDENSIPSKSIKKISKKSNLKKDFFEKIKCLFLAKNKGSLNEDKTIKLLFIHSYIVKILDPYVQTNEKPKVGFFKKIYNFFYNLFSSKKDLGDDYFKIYLTKISDSCNSSKFLDFKIEKDILETSIDHYNRLNLFPYSFINKPEPGRMIPSYHRETDKFSDLKNDEFDDSTEIALLHLCNCLFFYKGEYKLDHLPNSSKNLKDFYMKYKPFSALTMEIRNDWSKVVQDLNGNAIDNDSEYPTGNIIYMKKTNNKISPGIINMMNVLIKITGLQHKNILANANTLNQKVETLFQELAIKENRNSNGKIITKIYFYNRQETCKNNKFDFNGKIKLEFKNLDNTCTTVFIKHFNFLEFTEFSIMDIDYLSLDDNKKKIIFDKLQSSSYLNLMFESFLFRGEKLLGNYIEKNFESFLNKIYLNSRINSIRSILNIFSYFKVHFYRSKKMKMLKNS